MMKLVRRSRGSLAIATAIAAAVALCGFGAVTVASADDPPPTDNAWMGFAGDSITAASIAGSLMGDGASLTDAVTALTTAETQALLNGTGADLSTTFSTIFNILSDAVTSGLDLGQVASELNDVVGTVPSDTIGDPSTFSSTFSDPGPAPDPQPAPDAPSDLPPPDLPSASDDPAVALPAPPGGTVGRVEDVSLSPRISAGVASAAFAVPASAPAGSAAQMSHGESKATSYYSWSLHGERDTKVFYGHVSGCCYVTDGFFYDDYYINTYYGNDVDLISDLHNSTVHFTNLTYDLRRDNSNWPDDNIATYSCPSSGIRLSCTGQRTIPRNDGHWYFVRQVFRGSWGPYTHVWSIETRRAQSSFSGNPFRIYQYGG